MNDDTTSAVFALPCPPWCTVDHTEQDRKLAADLERVRQRAGRLDYNPDWMARWHTHTVASLHNPEAPNQPVKVTLFRDDQLENPDPERVVVCVEHGDCMPPELARRVALQVLEAVRIATGGPIAG